MRQIRKKMINIISNEITTCELKDVVSKLTTESIGKEIEIKCNSVSTNACVRKVKILKSPKYDVQKLLELHTSDSTTAMDIDASADIDGPVREGFSEPIPSDSVKYSQ